MGSTIFYRCPVRGAWLPHHRLHSSPRCCGNAGFIALLWGIETRAYCSPARNRKPRVFLRAGGAGMWNASNSPSSMIGSSQARQLPCFAPGGDVLCMLALRLIAHLPYFKIASVLMLPQGISDGGLLAAALVNALACLVASRWSAGLRRVAAELPHRAVLPLLGTTAVLLTMMVAGPALSTCFPRRPELVADAGGLLPAWLLILAPTAACYFAAQYLTAPGRRTVH